MHLFKSSVESLSGWGIGDISQAENVVVFDTLESVWINIKISIGVSKACFTHKRVGFNWSQGIEIVVVSLR